MSSKNSFQSKVKANFLNELCNLRDKRITLVNMFFSPSCLFLLILREEICFSPNGAGQISKGLRVLCGPLQKRYPKGKTFKITLPQELFIYYYNQNRCAARRVKLFGKFSGIFPLDFFYEPGPGSGLVREAAKFFFSVMSTKRGGVRALPLRKRFFLYVPL